MIPSLIKLFTSQDSILLAESSHYTYVYDDRESSLVIHNAQLEDLGVYTCTAKNLAGSVSCKAELTVHTGELNTLIEDDLCMWNISFCQLSKLFSDSP